MNDDDYGSVEQPPDDPAALYRRLSAMGRTEVCAAAVVAGVPNASGLSKEDAIRAMGGRP
jgi:hypothetical protein